ncbi:MAG: DUF1778 domain-containing protein [Actinobacteria bacterium]|nr:DUF1778 domain-containing protein [Actinomycetota bacterium]
MTRTDDETPNERAERLLADRTGFRLSSDAWDELVAIMDREASPNPKLAKLLSDRSDAWSRKGSLGATSSRRRAIDPLPRLPDVDARWERP